MAKYSHVDIFLFFMVITRKLAASFMSFAPQRNIAMTASHLRTVIHGVMRLLAVAGLNTWNKV